MPDAPAPAVLGPIGLGRGVVVAPGAPVPAGFESVERIVVGPAEVAEPGGVVQRLHAAWALRQPIVVELTADPASIRTPQIEMSEPWELDPAYEFPLDRLQFLLWANNYDARSGELVWWWARKAQRAFGSAVTPGTESDLVVDGQPVWCDGGPRQPLHERLPDGHRVLHRDSIDMGRLNLATYRVPASELAPDQFDAVMHQTGSARIIAPAGSGKTRVLTERLRHLIADRGWERDAICALAYNKRAADEMLERTSDITPHIRTLNSLGLAICNGSAGFLMPAGRPRRTVIEETQVRSMLDNLVELKRAPNTDPYVPYIEGLRAIRLALMDPQDAEVAYDAPGLPGVFGQYVTQLEERGLIDFDGQLYEAIRILLTDANARMQARTVARHLLVDEFQDLTPAHLLLIRLLASPVFDVFGVGDDDQVIYGFGGASPEFLLHFDQYFPGASPHALEVNYRCPPSVVQGATTLLSYNTERIVKHIQPAPGRTAVADELSVSAVADVEAAPTAVAQLDAWAADGVAHVDMAVLTRVNSTLLPVQVMLTQAGVPCRAPLNESILDRTGTRAALAYLRIGADPDRISRKDITETIRRPGRRIARNVVDLLTKKANTSVRDIKRLSDHLSGSDAQKLVNYAVDLERVAKAVRTGDAVQALRVIRVQVGLGDAMDVLDGSRREADRSTHGDDLIALEQVAALHDDPQTFERWLRQALRQRADVAGVELSTIHRVKGREWPRVVVYGADDALFPHRLSNDEAEERRLFHVAITRSREQCVVIANNEQPSIFLDELTGEAPHDRPKPPPTTTASRPAQEQRGVAAEIGLRVRMAAGYEGEIVEVRADSVLVEVDGAKMAVRFGEPVQIGRRSVTLSPPGKADLTPAAARLDEALRAWRTETAAREKMPAYIVLSNADISGIAMAAPASAAELAKCKGMGPVKLERYGDEILSVVDKALQR